MTPQQQIRRQALLTVAHREYGKGLTAHAFFKVQDRATGEDLVQDTFLKTWKYLVKGGKIDLMKPFLYHVLNNLIVDQYRKRKTSSLESLLEKGFEPSDESAERQEEAIDGKTVFLLIPQLPLAYRHIMRMKYVEELTLSEISRATGQTTNALSVKVHRGLKKLKVLYAVRGRYEHPTSSSV